MCTQKYLKGLESNPFINLRYFYNLKFKTDKTSSFAWMELLFNFSFCKFSWVCILCWVKSSLVNLTVSDWMTYLSAVQEHVELPWQRNMEELGDMVETSHAAHRWKHTIDQNRPLIWFKIGLTEESKPVPAEDTIEEEYLPFWATEEAQLEPGKRGEPREVTPTLVIEHIKLVFSEPLWKGSLKKWGHKSPVIKN